MEPADERRSLAMGSELARRSPAMSMQPHVTLVGAVLALTVLGCRNERSYDTDETTPPAPITPVPTEQSPPLIEDEDVLEGEQPAGEQQDPNEGQGPPDSIDPGADPKQAPPPSNRGKSKQASRG